MRWMERYSVPALNLSAPLRALGYVLDDGVAVAILLGHRHEDVKRGRRQRQEGIGVFHGFNYIHSGYMLTWV